MKVLLTGATGFIGLPVAQLLAGQDVELYALVRPNRNLEHIRAAILPQNLIYGDVLLDDLSGPILDLQPDLCIHLAWVVTPGEYLASQQNIDHLHATLRLAATLAKAGCQRFVGIGTCFEYDIAYGYLSEETPTSPNTLYGASKLAAQLVLGQLANESDMEIAWLRLFYLYGPFEKQQRLVSSVICSLLKNQTVNTTAGEQIRDYLYIEDVATAIWAVAQSKLCGPVNIGSGQPVSIREIISQIGAMLDRPNLISWGALPYGANESMFICANPRRLVENTNWQPRFTLASGLQMTIAWWQTWLEG